VGFSGLNALTPSSEAVTNVTLLPVIIQPGNISSKASHFGQSRLKIDWTLLDRGFDPKQIRLMSCASKAKTKTSSKAGRLLHRSGSNQQERKEHRLLWEVYRNE
jgi:hypothetical protein